jgi:hypothetical protein
MIEELQATEELQAILAADLGSFSDAGSLAETLYTRCYARSIAETAPSPETDEDLTPALIAANQSRAGWDFGWRADQALDDGRILARKAGAARAFRPGQYITLRGPGSKVEEGDEIQVFCAAGADLQAGFYYAFGETVPEFDEFEDVLRFYWNVPAEAAARLMELVTGEFNRWQTPFRFKCGRNSAVCGRRDAAVLYVQRPYYPMAARGWSGFMRKSGRNCAPACRCSRCGWRGGWDSPRIRGRASASLGALARIGARFWRRRWWPRARWSRCAATSKAAGCRSRSPG